jgi:hypothetical protein
MTPTRDGEWVKARYDNNPVGRIRQSCFETVVSLIGAMFTSHFRLREVVIRRNVPGGGFGVPCRIDLQRSRRESSPMTKTRDSVAGPAPTEPPLRLTQLSRARRRLVRLCQSINHGHIEALLVVDGEPTFTPAPTVFVDVKLDQDDRPRPEIDLPDFELCTELRRLMSRMDGIQRGKVARIEIRGGIPRRAIFETSLTGEGTTGEIAH